MVIISLIIILNIIFTNSIFEGSEKKAKIDDHILTRGSVQNPELYVELISPTNGTVLKTPSVELAWQCSWEDDPYVKYILYFDVTDPPLEIYSSNYNKTSIKIDSLINNEKYYWNVIPHLNYSRGECINGIGSFTIDVPENEIRKYYNIFIYGQDTLEMSPGDTKALPVTIQNTGIYDDKVIIEFSPSYLQYVEYSIESPQLVPKNNMIVRNFIIEAKDNAKSGIFKITLTAISQKSGELVSSKHIISITIRAQEIELDDEPPEPDSFWEDMLYIWLCFIGIFFVVLICAVAIYRYFKGELKIGKKGPDFIPYPDIPMHTTPQTPPGTYGVPGAQGTQMVGVAQMNQMAPTAPIYPMPPPNLQPSIYEQQQTNLYYQNKPKYEKKE